MSGRKRDIVWLSFDEIKNESRKGTRAKCKKCGYELEGQPARLKNHLNKCKYSSLKRSCEDNPGKLLFFNFSCVNICNIAVLQGVQKVPIVQIQI